MNELTTGLLQETKDAFANMRHSVLDAMVKLAQVKEQVAWEQVAPNWGQYVESELGISQSFASKLLTVHTNYFVLGGLSQEKLQGIDYECLYLAAKTEGTVEEQVAKARTLTRRELKEERNDDKPHDHEPVSICKICQIRL